MDELVTTNKKSKQGRILVVDDDMLILDTLEKGLSLSGYQCAVATRPTQALELFSKNVFDVMVTDIVFPGMSGFELTYKVKHSERYKDIPIILVTSLESKEDKERGIEAGANAYIVKRSFDQTNLLETIKRLI